MDVASSEFYVDGQYDLDKKVRQPGSTTKMLSGAELGAFYQDLCREFPIRSIEDAFDQVRTVTLRCHLLYLCLPTRRLHAQDDWENWTAFTSKVGKDVQIVGDDLTVTNPLRIKKAADMGACNALLLKVRNSMLTTDRR